MLQQPEILDYHPYCQLVDLSMLFQEQLDYLLPAISSDSSSSSSLTFPYPLVCDQSVDLYRVIKYLNECMDISSVLFTVTGDRKLLSISPPVLQLVQEQSLSPCHPHLPKLEFTNGKSCTCVLRYPLG